MCGFDSVKNGWSDEVFFFYLMLQSAHVELDEKTSGAIGRLKAILWLILYMGRVDVMIESTTAELQRVR